MQVNCAQCNFSAEIDLALLPVSGMEGRCPRCRGSIPLGSWSVAEVLAQSPHATTPPSPADPGAMSAVDEPVAEGRDSLINIIALLFLVDSTLSLLKLVPGLSAILGSSEMNFHLRAKYLYDTCMAAAFFISVFGLLTRKTWARIAFIVLLSLGLVEGLYLLLYQYVAIADLERNLKENFSELKQPLTGKFIGCLVYAFFIFKLNTRKYKTRFR